MTVVEHLDPAPTTDREPRHIVVVDVETTSFTPDYRLGPLGTPVGGEYGVVTEVAFWDLSTGESGCFVPQHNVRAARAYGALGALTVSKYLERLADAKQDNGTLTADLYSRLDGNTVAGSNPGFDMRFLTALFAEHDLDVDNGPWHHRPLDLSNVAATALGIPFTKLPGLSTVCQHLEVELRDAHTAEGDVRATGECLNKLMDAGPGCVLRDDEGARVMGWPR